MEKPAEVFREKCWRKCDEHPTLNPTRVAVQMSRTGRRLAAVVAGQPARITAADRMQDLPTTQSKAMITEFDIDVSSLDAFLAQFDGTLASVDRTDGMRVTLQDDRCQS